MVSNILKLIEECKGGFSNLAFRLYFGGKVNNIDYVDLEELKKWEFEKGFSQGSDQMQKAMEEELNYRSWKVHRDTKIREIISNMK